MSLGISFEALCVLCTLDIPLYKATTNSDPEHVPAEPPKAKQGSGLGLEFRV